MREFKPKHYKVSALPSKSIPNAIIYVLDEALGRVRTYITTKTGEPIPLLDLNSGSGGGGITTLTSVGGTINITSAGTVRNIEIDSSLATLINSALQSGDNVSLLLNDVGYITLADVPPFDPTGYDLDDFNNASADPFARQSELPTGGTTNLGYTPSPTNGTVTSDTGSDAVIPLADDTDAGLAEPTTNSKAQSAIQPSDLGAVATSNDYNDLDNLPTKTSDFTNDGENGIDPFITMKQLPSTLILFPTNVASSVGGYVKLVTSIDDPDYNEPAVDIPTGEITGVGQSISSLTTEEGIIIGTPPIFNITTIGNIRRVSGTATAVFYFEVYKRTALGVETLIGTSDNTLNVSSATYVEFNASAVWNNGTFTATDRIVLKFYGSKVGAGSNPSYEFQFGGSTPVRTLVPVPLSVIPTNNDLSSLIRQQFTYTSGAQTFTLTEAPSGIYAVFVNGQELNTDQFSIATNVLTIIDTLISGDKVNILYSGQPVGVIPSYTKVETDALFDDKISKHVGATYTTNAIQTVTQAEYDALTPDASTLYFII